MANDGCTQNDNPSHTDDHGSLSVARLMMFIAMLLSTLVSCSQAPVAFIKQSAGEMALIDRVKVERQRQFSVPSISNIGFMVMPLAPASPLLNPDKYSKKQLAAKMNKEGTYTFNHVFASVTPLNNSESRLPAKLDFVIKMSLLDAVTHLKVDATLDSEEVDIPKERKAAVLHSRVRPFHALIKLELLDARTGRSLDVALIKARSGALGSAKFSSLLRQGLRAYSKAITVTQLSVF